MASSALAKPIKLTDALAKIVGASVTTRAEAVKAIWTYIKANNLQDPQVKSVIKCDDLMKSAFKVDSFKQTEIFGLISKNTEKPAEAKMQ